MIKISSLNIEKSAILNEFDDALTLEIWGQWLENSVFKL